MTVKGSRHWWTMSTIRQNYSRLPPTGSSTCTSSSQSASIFRHNLSHADVIRAIDAYFLAREILVQELINEGCRSRAAGIGNEHAFEVALLHCQHLFYLRRYTYAIFHLYLMTGRLQDFYNLSCSFAKKGPPHFKWNKIFWNDHEVDLDSANHSRPLSKSFFHQDPGECSYVVMTCGTDWTALCFVLVMKYMLHTFMESLSLINEQYLGNDDCIGLIGQFLGIKKEWIILKKNWYRNQALEVARFLHCDSRCTIDDEDDGGIRKHFDGVKTTFSSAYYLPGELKHAAHAAIDAALLWIDEIELRQTREANLPTTKWQELIQCHEADHKILYTTEIRPALPWAIGKVNKMAGYDAICAHVYPALDLTKFFTECIRELAGPWAEFFFFHLFECIDSQMEYNEAGEEAGMDESLAFDNKGCFGNAVMTCLLIERKLAQCHLYKNSQSSDAVAILSSLPGGKDFYISHIQPEHPKGPFFGWFDDGPDDLATEDKVEKILTEGLPDVTKLVTALFEAGQATDANLTTLFGNSGYVSYQLWKLQRRQEESRQRSITPFIRRSRFWKEGCIDNDKKLGMKIRYLNKEDRRQRFEEIKKLVSVGNSISHLQPSLSQFAAKFGWEALGIEPEDYGGFCSSSSECEASTCSIAKRPRYELDVFSSVEDACRHYFDCLSIEETIWDFLGVPRVVILDANEEKMRRAGWQYCGSTSILGEKSVRLGSRVAHVYYSGSCVVWKERDLDKHLARGPFT